MYGLKRGMRYLRLGKAVSSPIPYRVFTCLYNISQGLWKLDPNHLRKLGVGEGCSHLPK